MRAGGQADKFNVTRFRHGGYNQRRVSRRSCNGPARPRCLFRTCSAVRNGLRPISPGTPPAAFAFAIPGSSPGQALQAQSCSACKRRGQPRM